MLCCKDKPNKNFEEYKIWAPLSKVCFVLDVMTVTSDARHLINAYFIIYVFI